MGDLSTLMMRSPTGGRVYQMPAQKCYLLHTSQLPMQDMNCFMALVIATAKAKIAKEPPEKPN